tara:strand:- start:1527 stop:1760 length:234 start_codon:yes stop_codon:yes gene_type:complete
MKYLSFWNKAPTPGDLVEVGWDHKNSKPFIGVVAEVRDDPRAQNQIQAPGLVLVNGKPKWCNLYDLKPVTHPENAEL